MENLSIICPLVISIQATMVIILIRITVEGFERKKRTFSSIISQFLFERAICNLNYKALL